MKEPEKYYYNNVANTLNLLQIMRKHGCKKIIFSSTCATYGEPERVFTKGTYHFPTIIGHEFAGEIVEAEDSALVGKGASVFTLLPCGKCEACRTI